MVLPAAEPDIPSEPENEMPPDMSGDNPVQDSIAGWVAISAVLSLYWRLIKNERQCLPYMRNQPDFSKEARLVCLSVMRSSVDLLHDLAHFAVEHKAHKVQRQGAVFQQRECLSELIAQGGG